MCVIFLCIVYSSVYVTLNITVTGVNFPPQIHTIALWMSNYIRIKQSIHVHCMPDFISSEIF